MEVWGNVGVLFVLAGVSRLFPVPCVGLFGGSGGACCFGVLAAFPFAVVGCVLCPCISAEPSSLGFGS